MLGRKATQEMRGVEIRLEINPALVLDPVQTAKSGGGQGFVDDFQLAHLEAAMGAAKAAGQFRQHIMIAAAACRAVDGFRREMEMAVPAGGINVVMLQEHRRRQHDIGEFGGVGHELLMHAQEKILAPETGVDFHGLRRDHRRVGVLDDHRGDRRALFDDRVLAHQDRADARHVEHTHRRVLHVEALDQGLIEGAGVNIPVVVKGAATAHRPFAGDRRQTGHRVQLLRAVTRAGKAVANPDKGLFGASIEMREVDNPLGRDAGDRFRPFRGFIGQMGLEFLGVGGEIGEIIAVGETVAEQHMHQRAGERHVGTRPQDIGVVGGLHAGRAIDVDDNELGAVFAGTGDMGHDIDLGRHRVTAPTDDQIGLGHFTGIRPHNLTDSGAPTGVGGKGADISDLARVAQIMAEAVDAVALYPAHGAGEIIRPNGGGIIFLAAFTERLGDPVEGFRPVDGREFAAPFGAGSQQRLRQPVRVVDALAVAGGFGAHHAGGVAVVLGAAHTADRAVVEDFDFERTHRRTVVRTRGTNDI